MSRVKRLFCKFKISLFGNVSCETLVLENILKERGLKPRFQTAFWRNVVWNLGFRPHFGVPSKSAEQVPSNKLTILIHVDR